MIWKWCAHAVDSSKTAKKKIVQNGGEKTSDREYVHLCIWAISREWEWEYAIEMEEIVAWDFITVHTVLMISFINFGKVEMHYRTDISVDSIDKFNIKRTTNLYTICNKCN